MTEEQKKVMRTQDIKYVEMKRVAEAKVSISFEHLMVQKYLCVESNFIFYIMHTRVLHSLLTNRSSIIFHEVIFCSIKL